VVFLDRVDAGRQLGAAVRRLELVDPVVVGLPRGGVVVAAGVAAGLGAQLDVIVVRKLGVPWHPELGMGAVGEDGVRLLNDEVIRQCRVSPDQVAAVELRERARLDLQVRAFRGERPPVALSGLPVVVVDDGVATGFTARAACQVAAARGAARVVLAVPTGPPGIDKKLADVADPVVCLSASRWATSVGAAYRDFDQTTDAEVVALLSSR
jgi:predicted phosphoribosyltransferase